MPCPALSSTAREIHCPQRILSLDRAGLLRCRACPRGTAIMETARVRKGEVEPLPDAARNKVFVTHCVIALQKPSRNFPPSPG
jgi:hypothetical protein